MASRKCVACGKKIGTFSDWQLCKSGNICMDCYHTAKRHPGDLYNMTSEEVAQIVAKFNSTAQSLSSIDEFEYVGHKFEYAAVFDEKSQTVFLPKYIASTIEEQGFWPFPYTDIVSAELLRNEEPVKASSLGRAVAGGLLFGVVGAVAGYASAQDERANGGIEHIQVVTSVRNYPGGKFTTELYKSGSYRSGDRSETFFNYGIEMVNRLNSIAGYIEPDSPVDKTPSLVGGADEIRKYKELLDDGIISQEEFDAKKRQILGL